MAVDQYVLAQNYEIDLILPDLMYEAGAGNPTSGDELLQIAPFDYVDAELIFWEQLENGFGLSSLRGLGNTPDVSTVPGARRMGVAPGYYADRYIHDEVEMTRSRELGTPNEPLDFEERLGKQILPFAAAKFLNRVRQSASDLFLTGRFRNVGRNGAVVHADKIEDYRTFSPLNDDTTGPGWAADPENATPINDLQYWQSQLELGTDSEFGSDSKLLFNPTVLVDLFRTRQFRSEYIARYGESITPEGLQEFVTKFGLPKFVVYKKNYYATEAAARARTGATRIIPNKSLIWVGTRPMGQKIARFVLTRNVPLALQRDGGGMAPLTSRAVDRFPWAEGLGISMKLKDELPWHYQMDLWFNGGFRVDYGSAVAGLTYQ
jgi:hypothetical protein